MRVDDRWRVRVSESAVESTRLIQALDASGLDGSVVDSHDRRYERWRRVWNGVIDRRPAVIVRARSVADVKRTIAVAGEAGSLIAVRCGGHSFPGFSTCDGGIVLDLSAMSRVVIDPGVRPRLPAGRGSVILIAPRRRTDLSRPRGWFPTRAQPA
jgi:hypothetical protein